MSTLKGIIITTVGERIGIRNIGQSEVNRFIDWINTGEPNSLFIGKSTWNHKSSMCYVRHRMVAGFEIVDE